VAGVVAGSAMATLNITVGLSTLVSGNAGIIIFGALATGFAMFLMVVTKTEHPPATALALGLVLNEWTSFTLLVVMAGMVLLSLCKQLVLPHLMDLS
jgi:CBS-domain-containing membrane protein